MKTIAVHYCSIGSVKASIAARVAAQLEGSGYAGREAARQTW